MFTPAFAYVIAILFTFRSFTCPAAGLHRRAAGLAHRALPGLIAFYLKRQEREARDAEIHFPAAPVDERGDGYRLPAETFNDIHDLAGRKAGRYHVLDDDAFLAGLYGKSPAERELSLDPFAEYGANAERAAYLLAYDYTAERRGNDEVDMRRFLLIFRRAPAPAAPRRRDAGVSAPTGNTCPSGARSKAGNGLKGAPGIS
jgi:hypothetical protein